MGMRENLITNWKDKTIEYQGKELYIIEQFMYRETEYLYAVDKATLNKKNIEVAFLYKLKDDIFANVDSDKLFDELLEEVSKKNLEELTINAIEKLKKNK